MVYFEWCAHGVLFCALTLNLCLLGEHEFLDVWNESYAAVMRYSRSLDGLWVGLHFRGWAIDLKCCSIDKYK
jgi:hypothetical protein